MSAEPIIETPVDPAPVAPVADAKPVVEPVAPVEPTAAPVPAAEPAAADADDAPSTGPWGDDWREKAAGEDEKAQKLLARYKSPQDFVKAHQALQQKMSSGEYKAALPADATDEQKAAWRTENNIPNDPAEYLDNLADGLVVGEEDIPILKESMLPAAQKVDMRPDQVSGMIEWYYGEQQKNMEALATEDASFRQASEDELRAEWGGEYRPNQNIIANYLTTLPGDLKDQLAGARLGDGSPMMAHPDVARWLVTTASELNPAGTVVPSGGDNRMSDLSTRRTELESMMRTDRAKYDKHHKEEYGQILQTMEKLGKL